MTILRSQEASDDAIGRNRIADHHDRSEPEAPVRVGRELAPEIVFGLLGILVLVETDRRGVPDVDRGALDRSSRAVYDARRHEQGMAGGVGPNDAPAILDAR